MIRLSRLSSAETDQLLRTIANEPVTYSEVGGTSNATLPPRYHHVRESVVVGRGDDDFRRGQEALREWAAHKQIGADVLPSDAKLNPGVTVLVTVPIGPVVVIAPCRIVSVTDTADAFGFAYGTLPGHAECGEESFTIRRDRDGQIVFEVVAFSRPSDLLVRLGGPVSRQLQRRATRGYLEGVRRFVAAGEPQR
jgi:uncharacterized protein (UPF0548 family)